MIHTRPYLGALITDLISQGKIPKTSSYAGFRTDASANCRLRAGQSTRFTPFYMSLTDVFCPFNHPHRPADVLYRSIPLASFGVSLIVANTITAERLAFTAGF